MFTGIIETLGEIVAIEQENSNVHFTVRSAFTSELQIDQSVAHNGVCLTIVAIDGDMFVVTAIQETLEKTTLASWEIGDTINLERAMKLGARLDGHIVQGHVDETGVCTVVTDANGSTLFTFSHNSNTGNITIEKGSITINGVSLTVVNSKAHSFSVAIIPYTLAHTTFANCKKGMAVNLEFDVLGKYVAKLASLQG